LPNVRTISLKHPEQEEKEPENPIKKLSNPELEKRLDTKTKVNTSANSNNFSVIKEDKKKKTQVCCLII
jgi:hypothetical protein